MQLEIGGGKARAKGWSIVAVGLAVALAGLDLVVLRGERVDGASVSLSSDAPAVLEIQRVGEPHRVEISTRRRRHGETKGRSVSYRLEGPDGQVVAEESELVSRKTRAVRFEPAVAGDYRLFVDDEGLLGAGSGSARVTVYVNDRRILGRLLPF